MNDETRQPDPAAMPGALREAWMLARFFGSQRWLSLMVIVLGLGAAVAETLGIGLAVMFLFALLQQNERIAESGGLLADIYLKIASVSGGSAMLIATVFFLLMLVNAALVYANQAIIGLFMNRVAERVRDLMHETYVRVGYGWLQSRRQGTLMHLLDTESWNVSEAFYSLARMAINLCAIVVFASFLLVLSPPIALTALGGAIVALLLMRLVSRPMRGLGERMLAANHILAQRMLASLMGMRTLRVFARETQMLERFREASSEVRRLAVRLEMLKALTRPMTEVLSLGILILIALVSRHYGTGVPTIIAAVLLLFRMQPYLLDLETHRLTLVEYAAALREVREIIDPEGKPWPRGDGENFAGLAREIRFDDVLFSHDPRAGASLKGVSFSIPAGRTTLISGPSGSGKTTILNLLMRLYEPDGGRILADDADVTALSRPSWLDRLGVAGQDVELIEGTVLDNIRFGRPEAPVERVREICAMVEILADIDALPEGLDSPIGAAGSSFSGGQRQRLGLARALVRDPEILLLDEAMSAMEPALENRIRARVTALMEGRTVLVVSHREDAAEHADHVVRIEAGRIIGQTDVRRGASGG